MLSSFAVSWETTRPSLCLRWRDRALLALSSAASQDFSDWIWSSCCSSTRTFSVFRLLTSDITSSLFFSRSSANSSNSLLTELKAVSPCCSSLSSSSMTTDLAVSSCGHISPSDSSTRGPDGRTHLSRALLGLIAHDLRHPPPRHSQGDHGVVVRLWIIDGEDRQDTLRDNPRSYPTHCYCRCSRRSCSSSGCFSYLLCRCPGDSEDFCDLNEILELPLSSLFTVSQFVVVNSPPTQIRQKVRWQVSQNINSW